jgi:hypothetical protein
MTWRWWLFTGVLVLVVLTVERLVPASYEWIDRILRVGLFITATIVVMRRLRQRES